MDKQSPGTKLFYRRTDRGPLDHTGTVKTWGPKYVTVINDDTGKTEYCFHDGCKRADDVSPEAPPAEPVGASEEAPSRFSNLTPGSLLEYYPHAAGGRFAGYFVSYNAAHKRVTIEVITPNKNPPAVLTTVREDLVHAAQDSSHIYEHVCLGRCGTLVPIFANRTEPYCRRCCARAAWLGSEAGHRLAAEPGLILKLRKEHTSGQVCQQA